MGRGCCHKGGNCCHHGTQVSPTQKIVYPTQENVVKTYSEEMVKHIHPIHTTVVNCHTIKNKHVYPHTTSYENVVNEVDVNNGNDVAGISDNMYDGYSGNYGYSGKGCKRRRRPRWF